MRARDIRNRVIVMILAIAPAAHSLERVAARADSRPDNGWDASATCSVTYANTCTGWIWIWTGWGPDEIAGVIFDPCCEEGTLTSTQAYFWTGCPTGWGFTGTLAIRSVDSGCLGATISAHPLLPPPPGGPVIDQWTAPPGPVALTFRTSGYEFPQPTTIPTDHPAAGPTGPQACGICYPSTRPPHTFRFGTPDSPLCPGEPLNDGVCNAEALFWYAGFVCPSVIEPVPASWASVKNLYR